MLIGFWLDNTRSITNRQDEGIEISNCPEHLALSHPTNGPHPRKPQQLFSEALETNNDFLEAGRLSQGGRMPYTLKWPGGGESGPTLGWFVFHQSAPTFTYFLLLRAILPTSGRIDQSIERIEKSSSSVGDSNSTCSLVRLEPDFPGKLLIVRVNHSKYNNLLTIWSYFWVALLDSSRTRMQTVRGGPTSPRSLGQRVGQWGERSMSSMMMNARLALRVRMTTMFFFL